MRESWKPCNYNMTGWTGATQLWFGYRCAAQRAQNVGLYRNDQLCLPMGPGGGGRVLNWILTKYCRLSELIFAQMEAYLPGFWPIFRIRNWKLTKIRHFEGKTGKRVWFLVIAEWQGLRGFSEECWKGGLVERLREREKEVFTTAHPCNPFQEKYIPPRGWTSSWEEQQFQWERPMHESKS